MIAVERLHLRQGEFELQEVSFAIPTGNYAVLMGKSGSGKTSILEAIVGLRPPRRGKIHLGGIDVTDDPPAARGIGYVPQDGALFSTLNVYDHLAFALQIRNTALAQVRARVSTLADRLGLGALLKRFPAGLSGGEKQRVALGRALSFQPRYLLLDEPLSSLDEATRESLIPLLAELPKHEAVTVLHVTHNASEAQRLGDLLFRLENGAVRPDPA